MVDLEDGVTSTPGRTVHSKMSKLFFPDIDEAPASVWVGIRKVRHFLALQSLGI